MPRGSVVIPAHNEVAVIERCLHSLFRGLGDLRPEVVVACNACSDATADVVRASGYPVDVIELRRASKTAALRTAERMLSSFPRIYLDADVTLPGESAAALIRGLADGPALAGRPPIEYDTAGGSAGVQRYFRARARMPAVMGSLWGAGVYALSEAGRDRFGAFPEVLGDDLFIDTLFLRTEIDIFDCPPVVVRTPRHSSDLLKVLRRARRVESEVARLPRRTHGGGTAGSTRRDLARSALAGPDKACDAAVYAMYATGSRLLEVMNPSRGWARDESSRMVPA